MLFTVHSTGGFLTKIIIYSGFKNSYKKNPRNKKTGVYSWIAFCRTEKRGRKPDKSSSLRRLEFMSRTQKPWLKMAFKNSISAVYTKEFSKGRLKSFFVVVILISFLDVLLTCLLSAFFINVQKRPETNFWSSINIIYLGKSKDQSHTITSIELSSCLFVYIQWKLQLGNSQQFLKCWFV